MENPIFSNFLNTSKDPPELIYFMGYTGVGKSTLINYLLGVEMSHQKKWKRFKIFPKNGEEGEEIESLPKIGN